MSSAGDAFIIRTEPEPGEGPRVAVKDLIDVAGLPTSSGCRAVAETAEAAAADAGCVASLRSAGARFVGKTALHELAYGVTGVNPWYGTPANPLDGSRVPGGSSSGSAVVVAAGEADFALGSDTGGSIRIPAACCGIVGLKTTWGSIPLDGVRPLAPSFDTVGPMGRSVAAVARGYEMLVPAGGTPVVEIMGGRAARGLHAAAEAARRGAVVRLGGLGGVDPEIDDAVDAALRLAGLAAGRVIVDGWDDAFRAHRVILGAEAYEVNGPLLAGPSRDGVGDEVRGKLERAAATGPDAVEEARRVGRAFGGRMLDLLAEVGVLALPAIPCPPPRLGESWDRLVWLTAPINLVGFPALVVPVPLAGSVWTGGRASVQLVGAPGSERELLTLGELVEAGAGS